MARAALDVKPMVMTPEEVAEALGLDLKKVLAGVKNRRIPSLALGGRIIRIPITWVTAEQDRMELLGVPALEGIDPEMPDPEDVIIERALRRMDPRVVLNLISYDWLREVGLGWVEASDLRKEWRIAGDAMEDHDDTKRPYRVPERAKRRTIATAIGKVAIWYWPGLKGGWHARVGGPRQSSTHVRSSMMEAVKVAGEEARMTYGRRPRRTGIRLRFAILARDAFTCRYCGRKAPDVELRVDHITPVAEGGSDEPENLCAACSDCNAGKADVLL